MRDDEWPDCEVENCGRPVAVLKWKLCRRHYSRMRKYGDPTYAKYDRDDDPERWRHMYEVAENGCWLWTGRLDVHGYGIFATGGVERGAHRHIYQQLVRPLLPDEHLDHRCHSDDLSCPGGSDDPHRRCVRPDHLEVVPHSVNASRVHSANARKERCPADHPYDEENTVWVRHGQSWGRECRICRRNGSRERQRKHRGKADADVQPSNADKVKCKRGHALTPENVYIIPSTGSRQCKTCSRDRLREYKRAKRAAARLAAQG